MSVKLKCLKLKLNYWSESQRLHVTPMRVTTIICCPGLIRKTVPVQFQQLFTLCNI